MKQRRELIQKSGINIIKYAQELYEEKYKTLMKNIKKPEINGKHEMEATINLALIQFPPSNKHV